MNPWLRAAVELFVFGSCLAALWLTLFLAAAAFGRPG